MSEKLPTVFRGIAPLETRFTVSNVNTDSTKAYGATTLQQAGPEPDQPVPTTEGYMQLEGLGEVTSSQENVVHAVKEGAAVGSKRGGRFAWIPNGAAAPLNIRYRGWLSPRVAYHHEYVEYDGSTSTAGGEQFRALRTDTHKLVLVHTKLGSSLTLQCRVRDPVADTWASPVTVTTWPSGSYAKVPTIGRLPGGRLVCLYVDVQSFGTNIYRTLSFHFSDDDGATWTQGGQHIAGWRVDASTHTPVRLDMVYHDGYFTVLLEVDVPAGNDIVYHLVSRDFLGSVDQIETFVAGGAVELWQPSPVVDSAGRVIVFHQDGPTSAAVKYSRKSTPYGRFQDDPSFATTAISSVGGDYEQMHAVVDDHGYIWVGLYEVANPYNYILVSFHENDLNTIIVNDMTGESSLATVVWPINAGDDTGVYFIPSCLVPHKGHLVAIGQHNASNATTDNSINAIYLGGYSTIAWLYQAFGDSGGNAIGKCWFPWESPTTVAAWTVTGTATLSQSVAGLRVITSASTWNVQRLGPSGATAGRPMIVLAKWYVSSGGSTTTDACSIFLTCANGTYDYQVSLRLDTANYALRDVHGGADLATGSQSSGFKRWLIILEEDGGAGYVRCAYQDDHDTEWTSVGRFTVTDGGPAGARNQLDWGHGASTTSTSYWAYLLSSLDNEEARTGQNSTPALETQHGRPFSYLPLWLDAGQQIRSRGSSAFRGDQWLCSTRFEHGWHHLFTEVSSAMDVEWRSTDTTQQDLIVHLEGGTLMRMLSSTLIFGLFGTNADRVEIAGYNGGWTTLITLDTTEGLNGLYYDLDGTDAYPDTGTAHSAARYIRAGSLREGYAVFDPDGSGSGPNVHRIEEHSEGAWRDDAGKAAHLRVDGDSDTGAISTVDATGDFEIRSPHVVGIVHNVTTAYQAFRFRFLATSTAEGYFKASKIFIGPLVVFGRQYSLGRNLELRGNVSEIEDAAGHRDRTQQGASQRAVAIAWSDPWMTKQTWASSPNPDHQAAKTGYPGIGVEQDPSVVEGLLRRTKGGEHVVLYLPKVPTAADSDTHVLTDPEDFMLSHIVGGVSSTEPSGSENDDAVRTINAMRLEEVV